MTALHGAPTPELEGEVRVLMSTFEVAWEPTPTSAELLAGPEIIIHFSFHLMSSRCISSHLISARPWLGPTISAQPFCHRFVLVVSLKPTNSSHK